MILIRRKLTKGNRLSAAQRCYGVGTFDSSGAGGYRPTHRQPTIEDTKGGSVELAAQAGIT